MTDDIIILPFINVHVGCRKNCSYALFMISQEMLKRKESAEHSKHQSSTPKLFQHSEIVFYIFLYNMYG
jgi:hypothetical protein